MAAKKKLKPKNLGTGGAAQAGKALSDRAFKLKVAEAKALGEPAPKRVKKRK